MKKLISMLVFLLFAVSVAAQSDAASNENVGITPDSSFYGLDVALKRIRLALTFGEDNKAKKELEFANERLREIKLMIEQNKLDAVEKAEARHKEIIERLKLRLENSRVDGTERELEDKIEIETRLNEQETEIEDLKAIVELDGLTDNQRDTLRILVQRLEQRQSEAKLRLDAKEERIKVRLEEKGLRREEIETKLKEERADGLKIALTQRIANIRKNIEKSRERLGDSEDLIRAEERLKEAEKMVNEEDYDEAKRVVLEALKLANIAKTDNSEAKERILEQVREIKKENIERVEKVLEQEKERTEKEIEEIKETDDEEKEIDDVEEKEESSNSDRGSSY